MVSRIVGTKTSGIGAFVRIPLAFFVPSRLTDTADIFVAAARSTIINLAQFISEFFAAGILTLDKDSTCWKCGLGQELIHVVQPWQLHVNISQKFFCRPTSNPLF